MAWFVQLIIGLAFLVASYLLAPKIKKSKGPAFEDPEDPQAEAGIPIPILFGRKRKRALNCIALADKSKTTKKVRL